MSSDDNILSSLFKKAWCACSLLDIASGKKISNNCAPCFSRIDFVATLYRAIYRQVLLFYIQINTVVCAFQSIKIFYFLEIQYAFCLYIYNGNILVETFWNIFACVNHDYFLLHTISEYPDVTWIWNWHWAYHLIKKVHQWFHQLHHTFNKHFVLYTALTPITKFITLKAQIHSFCGG